MPPVPAVLAAAAEARGADAALSPLVRQVIDHLETNYLDPGLLRDLALMLNKSRFQIIRSFRREMHTTPHAYLIGLRIAHAIRLLQRGESIAQVAAATGFSDQSHLTRHFKRWTGTTPGVFLRS
ncbi:MAG TPA: AraC family transcriptional regulator [Stellaceae bacterium]|nr:AraC family transcriptional regulator [Stellaceae bacterium]